MPNKSNQLEYKSTPIPEDGLFKISPSGFAKFVSSPHIWYREEILGEDGFDYSTASVLGTVVHYCAEMVGKEEEVDTDEIEEYIKSFVVKEDFNPDTVLEQYIGMAERLVNDYVLDRPKFLEIESSKFAEVCDKFYAAGTLDVLEGTKDDCMITDYKTYSSKTKPRAIPQHYKYQILVYAWIYTQLGYTVNRVRLVYINRHIEGEISEKTQKQMKSYPPEVTVLTETITAEDIEFIGGLLHLCVDACYASEKYPELAHVIWHDPRLK